MKQQWEEQLRKEFFYKWCEIVGLPPIPEQTVFSDETNKLFDWFLTKLSQAKAERTEEIVNKLELDKIDQLHLKSLDFYQDDSTGGWGFGMENPDKSKIIKTIVIDKNEWARIFNHAIDDAITVAKTSLHLKESEK